MTVETVHSGAQNKNACWEDKARNLFYLKGDRTVKDSGGVYLMGNRRYASKKFVVWSDTEGGYIRKDIAKEVAVTAGLKKDYVPQSAPTYRIINTVTKEFVDVHIKVDEEEFNFDFISGLRYVGNNMAYLRENFGRAQGKRSYSGYPSDIYNYADLPQSLKTKTIRDAAQPKDSFPFAEEMFAGFRGLSFGIELETYRNFLPKKYLSKYGFVPVKDGSIKGDEFVSVPFSTLTGLQNIYHFADKLNQYARTDKTCSYHTHIGGITDKVRDSKLFIAAEHTLYLLLQDEITSMQPEYKTDLRSLMRNNRGNGKDYCKPLKYWGTRGKSVQERYERVFQWANDFQPMCENFNPETRMHRIQGVNKWDRKSRYYQLNVYPFFFSDSKTIEYRVHHGTIHPNRVVNWLCITMAITNFAIENGERILSDKVKYELADIVRWAYPEALAEYLVAYIDERKTLFANQSLSGDVGDISTFMDEGYNIPGEERAAQADNDAFSQRLVRELSQVARPTVLRATFSDSIGTIG